MIVPGAERFGSTLAGGSHFGDLVNALRQLTDAVSTTDAPDEIMSDALREIRRLTAALDAHVATGHHYPAGHRWELPARGHPLLLPLTIDELSDREMRGRVTFSRAHMGHTGIAHGGFIPLVFDEVLGVFPVQVDPPARTAYLHVTYRAGTPVLTELAVTARLVSVEGRKLLMRGTLHDGDTLLAEAEGLFIQPRTLMSGGQTRNCGA